MIEPIITIEKVSKKYQIGTLRPYYSLRDSIGEIGRKFMGLVEAKKRYSPSLKKSEFWALKDISFSVMPGEVVGIIGRNGAGKSTLLKILSQITPPTKGRITLYGKVASLLEVGTGFHPELTGRENIYLNGAILGMTRREIKEKIDEIISFAEIEKFLDTPVKYYSSGMYMRLAFSVAAHLEPDILVVDEVLAVGDAAFQKKCLGKMDTVAKSGRTVLFVSHNMSAVKSLCNRVIWISQGQIKETGNAEQVIEKYLKSTLEDEIPLLKRKDREGSGVVRIESFFVTNQRDNYVINVFDQIVTHIKLKNYSSYKTLQLKIAFIDQSDRTLFRIDTDNKLKSKVKNSEIIFRTDPINVAPTTISVNVGVFADGVLADYVKNIVSFTIVGEQRRNLQLYSSDISTLIIKHTIIN